MADQQCLLLFVVFLLAKASFNVADNTLDADILLKFKATINDETGALRSWEAKSVPCNKDNSNWAGVLCDNNIVFGLRLENMNLKGPLNIDALKNLPGLRSLSVLGNNFDGSMPNVAKLPRLRALFLSQNHFSGVIPDDIFTNMIWLKKLHLSQNEFSGSVPSSIANLQKLLELRLDDNKFEGTLPNLEQKELKLVNVSGNNLEGPIPDSLNKFDKELFTGNKGLCGAPFGAPCSPSQETSQLTSTPKYSSATKLAMLAILACTMLLMLALYARPRNKNAKQLGRTRSSDSSSEFTSYRKDKLDEGSTRSSTSQRRGGEQARIIFVRDDRESFELKDLLKSSAEVLGTGNFGCSYKATLISGSSMVVKRHKDMNKVSKEDFEEHMRRLGRLAHPNLLPLVAYYYRKEEKLFVTDYVPNRSLAKFLHGKGGLSTITLDWLTRLKIVRGVAQGLNYLYEEFQMLSIPHGHLKASNVLLSDSLEPLLTDYTLLPVMNQSHGAQFMVAYKAPEARLHGKTSKKSDIWSLGVLILEILTGKIPTTEVHDGKQAIDLEKWVKYQINEGKTGEIFDVNMKTTNNSQDEMIKLLQIGLACCEEDIDKRYDIETLLDKLDELKDDHAGEDENPTTVSLI